MSHRALILTCVLALGSLSGATASASSNGKPANCASMSGGASWSAGKVPSPTAVAAPQPPQPTSNTVAI